MKFHYQAKNKQGQILKGIVEARDKTSALTTLQSQDLIPISVISSSEVPFFARRLSVFDRVKNKDVVVFTRQLSILLEANVPVVDAIKTLQKQAKSPVFQEVIFRLGADVEGGLPLSEAMAKHPKAFSRLFVNVVRSGEASGELHKSLLYLADYLEKQHDLKGKIKNAMMYPAFIVVFLIIVGVAMLIWVIPKLTGLITQSGQELPLPTKILISTSDFVRGYWWLVLLLLAGAGIAGYFFLKTPGGRRKLDKVKLKLPVFGSLLKKMYMVRLADNLATLISGGIPIVKSIQTTARVINNYVYEDILMTTADKVKAGVSINEVFSNYKAIPSMVTQMIAIGEKTGKIDESLKNVSKFYAREVDNTIAGLTQLLEPIIIVTMAVGVAGLVASILMPVYQVATSAG